jgi:hypothetical protein
MRTLVINVALWCCVACVSAPAAGGGAPSAGMAGGDSGQAGSPAPSKPPLEPGRRAAGAGGWNSGPGGRSAPMAGSDPAANGGMDASAPPSGRSAALGTGGRSAALGTGGRSAALGTGGRSAALGTGGRSAALATGGREAAPELAGSQPSAAESPHLAGQLVISELMIDPKTLSDAQGEWLELANTGAEPLELQGCALDDGGKEPRLIAAPLLAPAFGYVTIARGPQPGFEPSYVTSLSFSNSADTIALRCAEVEIDRVSYDKARGFPLVSGASLSLDPDQQSAQANDAAEAWCAGSESYGPELGSPGRANPPCARDADAGVER